MSELVSLSEAARTLQLSAQQVRRLADAGKLRCVRTPLGRVVERTSVEELARVRAALKGSA